MYFRKGKYDLLVATDIAAHGIDVSEVTHVINFDFPGTTDDYTHRVGRTGRAKQSGQAFSLITPEDKQLFNQTKKKLDIEIPLESFKDFDYGIFNPSTFNDPIKRNSQTQSGEAKPKKPPHFYRKSAGNKYRKDVNGYRRSRSSSSGEKMKTNTSSNNYKRRVRPKSKSKV